MAKTPAVRTPRPPQKHPRAHTERKGDNDPYISIGRFAGLIGFPSMAIYAQSDMVGEPWRHYLGVAAIVGTVVWAYGTRPDLIAAMVKVAKTKWMK